MNLNLSKETRQHLLEKFYALETVKQKLSFLQKGMPINYMSFLEACKDHQELHPFKIVPKENEIEQLNKWFLENYHKQSKNEKRKKNY